MGASGSRAGRGKEEGEEKEEKERVPEANGGDKPKTGKRTQKSSLKKEEELEFRASAALEALYEGVLECCLGAPEGRAAEWAVAYGRARAKVYDPVAERFGSGQPPTLGRAEVGHVVDRLVNLIGRRGAEIADAAVQRVSREVLDEIAQSLGKEDVRAIEGEIERFREAVARRAPAAAADLRRRSEAVADDLAQFVGVAGSGRVTGAELLPGLVAWMASLETVECLPG